MALRGRDRRFPAVRAELLGSGAASRTAGPFGYARIRFLTADDYPPLNFALDDGTLAGFNVEIARAICQTLEFGCTIQARPFDTLIELADDREGDAVIASIAATPATRAQPTSRSPLPDPGAFVARKDSASPDGAGALAGKTIGVVAGSSHEAYLKAFFPAAKTETLSERLGPRDGVARLQIDAAFGDGLTFAVWLNGEFREAAAPSWAAHILKVDSSAKA